MKKGFATSGILYTMLLLFVVLLFGVLQNLQNKKTILDKLKLETINALSCNCTQITSDIESLKSELINLKNMIQVDTEWNTLLPYTTWTTTPPSGIALPTEYKELVFLISAPSAHNSTVTVPKKIIDDVQSIVRHQNNLSLSVGGSNNFNYMIFHIYDNVLKVNNYYYSESDIVTNGNFFKALAIYYR